MFSSISTPGQDETKASANQPVDMDRENCRRLRLWQLSGQSPARFASTICFGYIDIGLVGEEISVQSNAFTHEELPLFKEIYHELA